MRTRGQWLVAGVCVLASPALAQYQYQVDSATPVPIGSGNPATINVGTVSGVVTVRIWDPTLVGGLPDADAGKITISGTWTSGGELRVLVAGASTSWPTTPNVILTNTGLRNLGLTSTDGVEITDPDLARHTRLAAFTSDDPPPAKPLEKAKWPKRALSHGASEDSGAFLFGSLAICPVVHLAVSSSAFVIRHS